MPESISHEGYSSRAVHAYWDDFWTLRGLKDAASLARLMRDEIRAARYSALREAFSRDLYASLQRTMARHKLDFIPGSVELGDFDPNATAMAVTVGGELPNLPQPALQKTFDEWYEYFEKRRDGKIDWEGYTPYEVRIVEALVYLGQRERAWALMNSLLRDQRPAAWNQWPEVVWRDPNRPKFIGDMPHAWIGAEYVRALRSLFAYERESDQALVLAAGLPRAWVESETGVVLKSLPTWYGTLDYHLRGDAQGELRLQLSGGLTLPPGKIVLKAPSPKPLREVYVNGKPVTGFKADEVVIGEFPAEVVLRY